MGPEHAHTFAHGGWSKADVQDALYRQARLSFRKLMLNKEEKGLLAAHPELCWLFEHPGIMLPVVESPDCFILVVVGGAAGRSLYLSGAGAPVTKLVER